MNTLRTVGRSLILVFALTSASWGVEVTATRSITGPDANGALSVTVQVGVSVGAGEESPGGVIVSEHVPLGSTVSGASPNFGYYRERTGEIAWLFTSQSGVTNQTVSYTLQPAGTSATVGGTVYYGQGRYVRSVPIRGTGTVEGTGFGGIRGFVRDAQDGSPLEGVTVSSAGHNATSGPQGRYRIRSVPAGTQTLEASSPGLSSVPVSVTIQRGQVVVQNLFMVATQALERPVVVLVKPEYDGIYLDGIHFANRYQASVLWNGSPGTVTFDLNGQPFEESGGSGGASHTFDMGTDFDASLYADGNTLAVTARNAAGQESLPFTLHPYVVPRPVWMQHPFVFTALAGEGGGAFHQQLAFPTEPLDTRVTLPSVIPGIGGHSFGIPPVQLEFEWNHRLDGSGDVGLALENQSSHPLFVAGPATIDGDIEGSGRYAFYPGQGFRWEGLTFGLGVSTEVGPPLIPELLITDFVPVLGTAARIPFVGRPIKMFGERAKVGMKIKPDIELSANIAFLPDGQWDFENGEAQGSVRVKLILTLKVTDSLKAEMYGGATPSITMQFPAKPGYLKELSMEIFAGVRITAWRFKYDFEASYTFTYPDDANGKIQLELIPGSEKITGPVPIERDYLARPDYSRFVANESVAKKVAKSGALSESGTSEHEIIENVYPYSEPALAVNDTERTLLFVFDDPKDPLFQATEIYSTEYSGGVWSEPHAILDDTRGEFNPDAAYDGNGNTIAVWERVKEENLTDPDIEALAGNLEIVWARFDGTSWSAPAALTDNGYLDQTPMLERGSDGTLLLVWSENEGNQLTGTAEFPGRLLSRIWDGSAWSGQQTALANMAGVIRPDVAYSGAEALAVYTLDMDGDLGGMTDQEIYAVVWDGSAWGAPQRLTDNSVPDGSPRVVYSPEGEPIVVWEQGEQLVMRRGLTGEDTPLGAEGIASGIVDFKLTVDNAGNLVLIWQDDSPEGTDAFYAVYDAEHDRWSRTLQLTADESVEQDFSATFDPNGVLQMAYNKVQVEYVDYGGGPVPMAGRADLYVLEHTLGENLSIEPPSLRISPPNPALGSDVILSASVGNTGDTAIENVAVAFFDGTPESGNQIGDTILIESLDAGDKAPVSLPWTVPFAHVPHTISVAVDPGNEVLEADETDNTASVVTVLPDIQFAGVTARKSVDPFIDLQATVENAGAIRCASVAVEFSQAAAGLIGSATIDLLEPGAAETVQVSLDTTGIEFTAENREVIVTVRLQPETREWDLSNNQRRVLLPVEVEPVRIENWNRY